MLMSRAILFPLRLMTIHPIIKLPDPRLRLVSERLAVVDDEARALLDDMLQTMYDAPGIGLAAVQIGVLRRMVVMDVSKGDDPPLPLFLINPEVIWSSPEARVYEEGCLSIPEVYEDVERPERVRVRFLDRDGKAREIEADGLLATCLQHEIDHTNGVLFIDHISRLKRERVVRKARKAAKRDGAESAEP